MQDLTAGTTPSLASTTFPISVPHPSFSQTTFATRPQSLNTLQTPPSQTQQATEFSATCSLPTSKSKYAPLGTWPTDTLSMLYCFSHQTTLLQNRGTYGGGSQWQGVPEPPHEKMAEMEPGLPEYTEPLETKHIDHLINAIPQNQLLRVPQARINTQPGNTVHPFQEIAPFCVSANNLINPLPPSLGGPNFHVTGHYWYSTLPTSKIRIPIQVGAGDIGTYYLKEPWRGKRDFVLGGRQRWRSEGYRKWEYR